MTRRSLAALLVVVAGCGGDDRAPAPERPEARSDVEQVAATVRRQGEAVAAGKGERACGYLSARARQDLERALARRAPELRPDCVFAVGEGAAALTDDLRSAIRRPRIVSVRVEGDGAEVEVETPEALRRLGAGERLGLRRVGGAWKVDDLGL